MTLVDETSSAFMSRMEVRGRLDTALDETGAQIAARLVGRPSGEVDRDLWADDPSNEAGAAGLMAVAAGQGR